MNRVALVSFVRKGLSGKDWDAYVEQFGVPAVFVILPKDVPEKELDTYMEVADKVTGDARGVLPGGSDVKVVDAGGRGVNPFRDHLRYQDEQMVLRGTGGLLTMLTESGSGTLAGSAHMEAFDMIARAEAAVVSELLRKQIDREVIARATPGERAYAYFELAANEETDTSAIVMDVASLAGAGYLVSEDWIDEKTGYPVSRATLPEAEKREGVAAPLRRSAVSSQGKSSVHRCGGRASPPLNRILRRKLIIGKSRRVRGQAREMSQQ